MDKLEEKELFVELLKTKWTKLDRIKNDLDILQKYNKIDKIDLFLPSQDCITIDDKNISNDIISFLRKTYKQELQNIAKEIKQERQ